MKLCKVETSSPKNGEYYIVYCPEYCESEHHVARWDTNKESWISEEAGTGINDFVEGYYNKPLSDW